MRSRWNNWTNLIWTIKVTNLQGSYSLLEQTSQCPRIVQSVRIATQYKLKKLKPYARLVLWYHKSNNQVSPSEPGALPFSRIQIGVRTNDGMIETRFRQWSSWKNGERKFAEKWCSVVGSYQRITRRSIFPGSFFNSFRAWSRQWSELWLHCSYGWFRITRDRIDTCRLLMNSTAFWYSFLVDLIIVLIKSDLGR